MFPLVINVPVIVGIYAAVLTDPVLMLYGICIVTVKRTGFLAYGEQDAALNKEVLGFLFELSIAGYGIIIWMLFLFCIGIGRFLLSRLVLSRPDIGERLLVLDKSTQRP